MVIRTIANRVGTIEIDQNAFYFLQPLSAFKTEEMEQIERAYEKQMQLVTGDPTFLSAQEISFQSGQVRFEYDLTDLHSFNALKAMAFEDKLTYYLSLVQLARQSEVNVLWQKENFVLNKEESLLHVMVTENDVMPLSQEKDRLMAVKELIIISLTRLNQVYGRPRRTDFLEQSDEVIRFAETIYLRLQSLEEMESYISDVFNQVEEQKKAKQQELELAKQNQTKWSVTMASLSESLQRLPAFNRRTKENLTKPAAGGNKKLFVGVAAVLLAAFGLNVVLTQATENAQETELGEGTDGELNLTDVYRDGLLGDTESVLESLESVDYSELQPADQNVLTHLYIEQGEYEKALHHQPELLGTIAEQLSRDEDVEGLENLQETTEESSEVIEFELAAVEEEWTRIIELRNQVELTNRRAETVLAAFIEEKDFQGAKGFLEKHDLADEKWMSSVLEAEKQTLQLEELEAEKQKLEEAMEKENDKKASKKAERRLREIDQEIEAITKQE
ncbi:hypothetical protein H1Q58_08060 [Planococcus maritimus]|uniref:Uncharacterized protein n=1 Tax=Planococcus maritimus TaxID=192421 RepID=A0A7D7RC05_PLAMR|nr:hypothetical protein [Planococcus maritimus]QMT18898.1 hypothetical protein H1Q58_08060 [Planococcus maritimus]